MKPAHVNPLPHHTLRLRPLAFALFGASLCAFPGMADAQVVVAGGNTKVYQAPNGVQVVDIATANNAGVSHNVFTEFNVARNGMVLNNGDSSQMTRQSQLAGQVSANLNLNNSARIILNEVTGANRSTLAGHMEVLGSAAEVVIANPYGITCDGCGFINTPRATLSTGVPVFDAEGRMTGLRVGRGDIVVSGTGLNGTGLDYLDLVARSIRIDGQVNAGDLTLAAGANNWDYASRSATANGAANGADTAAPALGIDSSALGGMYANRIRLMATEEGVGVRLLGDAAASAAELAIDAKGQITLQGRLSAQAGDIAVNARGQGGGIAVSGRNASISAAGDIALKAAGADIVLDDASLRAGRDLTLNTGGALRDTASAGNAEALRHAARDLSLTAAGKATIAGSTWGADGALGMRTDALQVGAAAIYSGKELTLATTNGGLQLDATRVTGHGALALDAGQGALGLDASTRVTGAGAIALDGAAVTNVGSVIGEEGVALHASSLNNSGLLQAAARLAVEARGKVVNSGSLLAGGTLGLQAASLDNSGVAQAGAGLEAAVDTDLINNGKLLATNEMTLTGRHAGFGLDNHGLIQAGGALDIGDATHRARLNNGATGTIAAGLDTLVLESLVNAGILQARDGLLVSVSGDATNAGSGLILARGQAGAELAIDAGGKLRNDGALQSDGSLLLNAGGALDNTGTAVTRAGTDGGSDGAIALRGASIGNDGAIGAAGKLDMISHSFLANAGTAQAGGPLAATVGSALTNGANGKLLSLGSVTISGSGVGFVLGNSGRIQAGGALAVGGDAGRADLRNGENAVLSGRGATLVLGSLVNEGGTIGSSGDAALAIDAAGHVENAGTMESGGAFTLAGGAAIDNAGVIVTLGRGNGGADGDVTLASKGKLTNSGHIEAAGTLAVGNEANLSDLDNRKGAVLVAKEANLATAKFDNAGVIQADGALRLQAGGTLTNAAGGEMVALDGKLELSADTLVNGGALQSGRDMTLAASGELDNSGSMQALGGDLVLRASHVNNSSTGFAYGAGYLLVNAGSRLDNGGKLVAGATIDITGASQGFVLANTGWIQSAGALQLGRADSRVALNNAAGATVLGGRTGLWLTTLDNDGLVQSTGTLDVDALSNVTNGSEEASPAERDAATLLASGAMTLTSAGNVVNRGRLLGAGSASVNAATIDNSGLVQGTAGLDMTANTFWNTGSLLSGARLGLTGRNGVFTLDNRNRIQAATDLDIGSAASLADMTNGVDGVIVGGDLTITGSVLANAGLVQGTNLDLDVSGKLSNTGRARLLADGAGGLLQLNAAELENEGTVESSGSMAASAASIKNLTGGSIRTVAAAKEGPAGGSLTLDAGAGNLENGGGIASNGALNLDAAAVSNSGIMTSRQTLSADVDKSFSNSGRITSAANLVLRSSQQGFSVTNAAKGTIESAGTLRIGAESAAAGVGNSGTILGNKVAVVATSFDNTGVGSGMLGIGTNAVLDLKATGAVKNEGKLHSGGTLKVKAASIDNGIDAGMSAGGTVDLRATNGDLVNDGWLFALGNVSLWAPGHAITNSATGNIDVKGGKLSFDTLGGNGGSVSNYNNINVSVGSGAQDAGNLSVKTGVFLNQASARLPDIVLGDLVWDGQEHLVGISDEFSCSGPFGQGDCARSRLYRYDFTAAQRYSFEFDPQTAPAQMLAEGDITIDYGSSGKNRFGIISGNNVTISAVGTNASFVNEDLHLKQLNFSRFVWGRIDGDKNFIPTTEALYDLLATVNPAEGGLWHEPPEVPGWMLVCEGRGCRNYRATAALMSANYAKQTGESYLQKQPVYSAGVFAKRQLKLNGNTTNTGAQPVAPDRDKPENMPTDDVTEVSPLTGAGRPGGAGLAPTGPAASSDSTRPDATQGSGRNTLQPGSGPAVLAPVLTVGANGLTTVVGANGVAFTGPNLNLPTSPNGLYVPAPANSTQYLVETNPLFVNGSAFGSNYLAERLGFDPVTVQKRLGDADYEAQLVREQLIAQTNNFLLDGYSRAADQMKGLLDSAASQSSALGLSFGVALTAEQAGQLTDDLVWMVETTVKGEKVLAPVVYLSAATREKVLGGAVLSGRDVSIEGGSLANNGGTIAASNQLAVTTQGDITNTSGAMRANTVALTSTEGSVVNKTTADFYGDDLYGRTSIGPTGTITATGNLAIDAARDVRVVGATLAAGGDATIKAGKDVVFDTIQDKRVDTVASGRDGNTQTRNEVDVRQIGSNVSSGGDMTISSGKNVTIAGSTVSAGGKLGVDAKGELEVVDRQDTNQVVEVKKTSSSGFTTKGASVGYAKTDTSETTRTTTGTSVGSTITSGGDTSLSAGKTLTVQGSDVAAGGDLAVNATDVKLLAGQDTFEQTIDKKTTTTGVSIGVDISAVTNAIGMNGKPSAADIARLAADAAGGQGITVGLNHSTTTTHSEQKDSTARVSTLTSGGKTSVTATDNARFEGTRVVAGGDIEVTGKSIDMVEARNSTSFTEKSETTGLNISTSIDPSAIARKAVADNLYSGGGGGVELAKVENKKRDAGNTSDTSTVTSFTSGGNIKRTATETLTDQGSQLVAAGDVVQKAKTINQVAATDRSSSWEDTTDNNGSIGLSVGFEPKKAVDDLRSGNPNSAVGLLDAPSIGVDANYTRETSNTQTVGTTAVTGKVLAGGKIVSESTGATRLEGVSLASGGDTSITASTLQVDAARNTSKTNTSGDEVTVDVRVQVDATGSPSGSLGGGYNRSKGNETESKAVVADISAGGKLTIATSGDARFEGTQLTAGKDAKIDAGGKVEMNTANDTASTSNSGWGVSAEIGVGTDNAKSVGVGTEVQKESSSSSTAKAGSIRTGGGLTIASQKDITLEGTTLGAGGDVTLDAKDKLNLLAARSTSAVDKLDVSASLSGSRSDNAEGIGAEAGVGTRRERSSTETGSDIVAGGKVVLKSGGATDMQGTQVDAGTGFEQQAASVTKRDANSSSSIEGVRVDASAQLARGRKTDAAAPASTGSTANANGTGGAGGNAPTAPSAPSAPTAPTAPAATKTAGAGASSAPAAGTGGKTAAAPSLGDKIDAGVSTVAGKIKDGYEAIGEKKESNPYGVAWASKTDESDSSATAVAIRTGSAADTTRLAQPVNLMALPAVKSAVQLNAALAAPLAQYGSPAAIPDTVKRAVLQQAGVAIPPGADLNALLKQTQSAGKDAAIQGLSTSNLNAEQHAAALKQLGLGN